MFIFRPQSQEEQARYTDLSRSAIIQLIHTVKVKIIYLQSVRKRIIC